MKTLNKVMLIGFLGKDPEVRFTQAGKAVATFSLATSSSWTDQSGEKHEQTEWHRIVAWGKLAEICGEYLQKGSKAYIEGRIQSREWNDNSGAKRTTVEVVANDLIMLGDTTRRTGTQRSESRSRDDYQPPPPQDDIPF
jgi:single-strand DNA-binding protein